MAQEEVARSSTLFPACNTPYRTMVSSATWMYLNAQLITSRNSLADKL